jgi:hypothetical protein
MPKKGKKTKADEKEDAFERLYAFLAASTPGLPSLEKIPLPVVEDLKPPTQEEKEKEKAEFDKLYRQLSSLSTRRKPVEIPVVLAVSPVVLAVSPVEIPIKPVEPNEFDEIYAQIMRIITMKSQMQPVSVKPVKLESVKLESVKLESVKLVKQKVKEILQCKACCKIFSTKGCFTRHQQTSSICQSWLSLPAEQQYPVVEIPIHVKVNEYLEQAITGEPLQCRFCLAKFINRGNHHKHYQTAIPCNRMAYAEFKRIVALSSNDLSDSDHVHS